MFPEVEKMFPDLLNELNQTEVTPLSSTEKKLALLMIITIVIIVNVITIIIISMTMIVGGVL